MQVQVHVHIHVCVWGGGGWVQMYTHILRYVVVVGREMSAYNVLCKLRNLICACKTREGRQISYSEVKCTYPTHKLSNHKLWLLRIYVHVHTLTSQTLYNITRIC